MVVVASDHERENAVQDEEAKGISCPHCGSQDSKVDYKRKRFVGVNVRRHTCNVCGGRYTTHERVVGVPEPSKRLDA